MEFIVLLRFGVQIWISREEAEKLIKEIRTVEKEYQLKNRHFFAILKDKVINTADVVAVFPANTKVENYKTIKEYGEI